MKKLLMVGVAIVALIVVVVFLLPNLGSFVAKAIEKHGGEATQTNVRVSGVDISLRDGRGSIKGLEVESPEGFNARTAFSLGEIVVDIDVKSVREDPIVIDEIRVQAPVVNAEITRTGSSNIDDLRKRVQTYAGSGAGEADEPGKATKRIRIARFVFEEGRIEVDASALGIEKRTIALPEIRLDDVGGAGGAPPDEIAKIILATVAEKAASEIAGSEIDRLVKEKLGGSVTDKVKDLLKKVKL